MTDDNTLISQQIDQAATVAQQLQQWLDAAARWRQAQEKQQQLQDRLAQAQQQLAALEAMYHDAAAQTGPAVSLDAALTELENCPTTSALFAAGADNPATPEADVVENRPAPTAEADVAENRPAPTAEADVAENRPAPTAEAEPASISSAAADLAELFALPPKKPADKEPEPDEDDLELAALLNADDSWMKNLDDLSRADDDEASAEDLNLLFKDIEEAPDSPWADPWDTVFETPAADSIAASDLLPPPEWDNNDTGLQSVAPAAPPAPKKRGWLSSFFR